MRIFYHDQFVLPLPAGHRFPMEKYSRLRERVAAAPFVAADRITNARSATSARSASPAGSVSSAGSASSAASVSPAGSASPAASVSPAGSASFAASASSAASASPGHGDSASAPKLASLEIGPAASDDELLSVHALEYVERVKNGTLSPAEIRRIGFPWSEQLVERSRRSVGSTIAATRSALLDGIGVNLAGGTHHAFADSGHGYCVFNDAAVAARLFQLDRVGSVSRGHGADPSNSHGPDRVSCASHGSASDRSSSCSPSPHEPHSSAPSRVVIIDCDVHQGDGTAAIFRGDPSVLTFSMHGEGNFPFRKERSDIDVALPDGTGDDGYLSALESALCSIATQGPFSLAIYLAGADPYHGDRLGRLSLTIRGLADRDRMVFRWCRSRSIPVAVCMAGGYADPVDDIVAIHFQTVELAMETRREWPR